MRDITRLIAVALCTAGFVSGCASAPALQVTYHSDPEGATLYEGTRLWGYTPMSLTYPGAAMAFSRGECLTLNPTTVRWASGAEASISGLKVCPAQGPYQQFVFIRPNEVPGREIDAQFALQVLQNAALAQQAAAQERAALYRYLLQDSASDSPPLRQCLSTESNGTILTTCQ